MTWWNTAAPYLQAAGVVVALLLSVANLAWLIIQGRRSRVTHAIALEAHEWTREKRERELRGRRGEAADALAVAIGRACTAVRAVVSEIPNDLQSRWQVIRQPGAEEGYVPRIMTGDVLRNSFDAARQRALPTLNALENAYLRARLYLDDQTLALAVEVREIAHFQIGKAVSLAAIELDAKKDAEEVGARLSEARKALFNRLFEIRERVVAALGPTARLESSDETPDRGVGG